MRLPSPPATTLRAVAVRPRRSLWNVSCRTGAAARVSVFGGAAAPFGQVREHIVAHGDLDHPALRLGRYHPSSFSSRARRELAPMRRVVIDRAHHPPPPGAFSPDNFDPPPPPGRGPMARVLIDRAHPPPPPRNRN